MLLLDYIVASIPMLGLLIFVHEFGHFAVAKLCGVRVLKFSLGFGPAIGIGRHRLRWVRGGTEYVIAWIPLGGFVRMLGEQLPGDGEQPGAVPPDARDTGYQREGRRLWVNADAAYLVRADGDAERWPAPRDTRAPHAHRR